MDNKTMIELGHLLMALKPKPTPTPAHMREWWHLDALPYLKDSALSQLMRTNQFKPTLIGFMKGGPPGVIDLDKATKGFGDTRSKNAAAFVHKLSAMVPGTIASVFCVEAWALRADSKGELRRQADKYPNLGDHPDRYEVVMFSMLSCDHDKNEIYQMTSMIEVIKVLGANTSPKAWRDTKLGEERTSDPMDQSGELRMKGRFIVSDPDYNG